jgi:hypothetical protein
VTGDPRLRIIDPGSGELAGQMLAALDGTEVIIVLAADLSGSARVAAGALAAMTARLFRHVTVTCADPAGTSLPANWWAAPDIDALISVANALLPASAEDAVTTATLTVSVGMVDGAVDFGIGGGDYNAVLDGQPVHVDAGTHHLGVHAAACLVLSQLLGKVLGTAGPRIVELDQRYELDLLAHVPAGTGHLQSFTHTPSLPTRPMREVVFAGGGSVGTSAAALAAMTLAPAYADTADAANVLFTVIDLDSFDPTSNPFRYPALLGGETDNKATMLADRLQQGGLNAEGVVDTVGHWVTGRDKPGVHGLVISSVDTIAGRLEVADIIAEQTLSIGVKALELHAQREQMDGVAACPFCHYIDAAPAMTQADVYVEMTGLTQNRVLELLAGDKLTAADIATASGAGKFAGEGVNLIGRRVEDLIGRIYADAQVPASDGGLALTIAFPQVSWFAGVLASVELVKQLRGLPILPGRVDVDLAGLPPGAVRVMPPDETGRCLCYSAVRRRAWTRLYDAGEVAAVEQWG